VSVYSQRGVGVSVPAYVTRRRIGLGRAVALPELDAVSSWSP
jgi:hypothetical protein